MLEPTNFGSEFRVSPSGPNVYTPVVAATTAGRHVVAWKGFGSAAIGDTDAGPTIFYRMFDSANQTTDSTPRVAVTNLIGEANDPIAVSTVNGGFAIAWTGGNPNVVNSGVVTKIQFFDASGGKVGNETTITLTNSSFGPSTIPFDLVQLGSSTGLVVRDGVANGASSLLLFDPATGARTSDPAIALGQNVDEVFPLAGGRIGTIRQAFGPAANVFTLREATGAIVNTTTFGVSTDFLYSSEVLSDGRVAVAYMRGGDRQILIHVIAADGSSVSAATTMQFAVGTTLLSNVNLVAHDDGGFSVIFDLRTGNNDDVLGQRFASDASTLGGFYQINRVSTTNTQWRSSVDQLSDGNFIVAWEDYRGGTFVPNAIFAGEFTLASGSVATDGPDSLVGTAGSDAMDGLAGNDTLDGAAGDDTLTGGAGADSLIGGAGFDYVSYNAATAGVQVDIGYSNGVGGEAQGDSFIGIEGVTASNFNDGVWGTEGDNAIFLWWGNDYADGREGNDTLAGGGGNDTLNGGGGSDLLNGDLGDDIVNGGDGVDALGGDAGNDALDGGRSADWLWGGDGSDAFVIDAASLANGVTDTVMDMQDSGTGNDWIRFVGVRYDQIFWYNQGTSAVIQIVLDGGVGSAYVEIKNFDLARLNDQYYFV